jgi:hypothetical protein
LPGFVRQLNAVASNRIEMKNLLNISLEGTQERYAKSVRAFCQQWHSVHQKDAVFDKSREWNAMPLAFRDISPDGVMILCVRDLRDIFASCEREEAKNGLITTAPTSVGDRYRALFCEQGVIGNPYRAVLSLMERMPANVHIVRYEDLIADLGQLESWRTRADTGAIQCRNQSRLTSFGRQRHSTITLSILSSNSSCQQRRRNWSPIYPRQLSALLKQQRQR